MVRITRLEEAYDLRRGRRILINTRFLEDLDRDDLSPVLSGNPFILFEIHFH
jgi:hypothetical protein